MNNLYLFHSVILLIRERNADIDKYVENSIEEGLRVIIRENIEAYCMDELLQGLLPDGKVKGVLVIAETASAAFAAKALGAAVLGYRRKGSSESAFITEYMAEELSSIEEDYLNMVYMRAHGIPLTIAVTQRTVIREMTVDDLPELYRIYADERVSRWVEPLYDYEKELEFTRAYISNMYGLYGYGLWLVFDREDGSLIGRAGLSNREIDSQQCVELGYIIAGPRMRQGYGYEVSRAILDYARYTLGQKEIRLCAEPDNTASVGLARKLGFSLYGETQSDGKRYLIYSYSFT